MTAEQIINLWKHERELSECVCSYFVDQVELSLVNETIDLINRQQAEIDKLNAENMLTISERNAFRTSFYDVLKQLKTAKSEAIKEFAEKLKERANRKFFETLDYVSTIEIDELVKVLENRN